MTRSLPLVTSSEPGPALVAAAKFPSSLAPRWDRRDGGGAGSSRDYRRRGGGGPATQPARSIAQLCWTARPAHSRPSTPTDGHHKENQNWAWSGL